jgi:hypothetical protein
MSARAVTAFLNLKETHSNGGCGYGGYSFGIICLTGVRIIYWWVF